MKPWKTIVGLGLIAVYLSACGPNLKWDATPRFYKVREGDTLYDISWRYGLNYLRVARWNGIARPYTIYPGQRIRLQAPPGGARPARAASAASQQRPQPASSDRAAKRPRVAASKPGIDMDWQWPVDGKLIHSFAVDDGQKGIDIAAKPGSIIRSASAGTVVYSGSGLIGYGRLIIIKHNAIFLSAYAHNNKLLVGEGEHVKSGQSIAKLGDSDRPELHFEIRRDGRPVNPLHYLPAR